jgi:Na+-driven multidrug efflux pump
MDLDFPELGIVGAAIGTIVLVLLWLLYALSHEAKRKVSAFSKVFHQKKSRKRLFKPLNLTISNANVFSGFVYGAIWLSGRLGITNHANQIALSLGRLRLCLPWV